MHSTLEVKVHINNADDVIIMAQHKNTFSGRNTILI